MSENAGAFADFKRKEEALLKKYGWIFHAVAEAEGYPSGINYHTHGLTEKYRHPDLQICFPIHPDIAGRIFHVLVDQIREGQELRSEAFLLNQDGQPLTIRCLKAKEGDREVIRLIFPDENGRLDKPVYAAQLEGTSSICQEDFPH